MRRLLSLDYVLERPELGWLATEPEKLAYLQRLGVSLAVVPYRLHRGPCADRPTRRYFPLKLPIAGSGTTTTFVYAYPGGRRGLQSDRIGSWVAAHAALWDALRVRGGAVHVVASPAPGTPPPRTRRSSKPGAGRPRPPFPALKPTSTSSTKSNSSRPPTTSDPPFCVLICSQDHSEGSQYSLAPL